MKAIYFTETGSPDVLQYGDLPTPKIDRDQVLVRIRAASLNPIDTYLRNGANYWPLTFPFVPGCDFAGEIVELGPTVSHWKVGDRVWGSNQGLLGRQGTFAEFAAIDSHWLYPIPKETSYEEAAACALVGITAHLGLFAKGQFRADETLFVRGGTGGVGSMVVQMACAMGGKVITTAGSDSKAQRCRELGAHHVIRHPTDALLDEIQTFAPEGVDLFWETLRDPDFDLAVAAMRESGRMILMAGRDARPNFPVGPFYVKGCSLHGFVMFKAPPQLQQLAANDINHWFTTGALRAQIDRVLPLSEARQAHQLQESNTVQRSGGLAGKIVLRVD